MDMLYQNTQNKEATAKPRVKLFCKFTERFSKF